MDSVTHRPRLVPPALSLEALLPRMPTASEPLRMLVSACLVGLRCGWDGDAYPSELLQRLVALPLVAPVPFCPEHYSFGTPRALSSIHGGDGFDVLDGSARVINVDGTDWTRGALRGARAMVATAVEHRVELCVLMDISPACGSHVVYRGYPAEEQYQNGPGVATALLMRNGVSVVAQRDHYTLSAILARLDPTFDPDPDAVDHEHGAWFVETFGS